MEIRPTPPLLTIAGFDPSSGAGVTADLQTFVSHRRFGISVISALTVQSTLGVLRVEAIASEVLRQSLDCLQQDIPPAGIKIGMLASYDNVMAVAQYLRSHPSRPTTVLDPVIRSSSGAELLSPEGRVALLEELLPMVDWITPNDAELCMLVGTGEEVMEGVDRLRKTHPHLGVVVTGGETNPPADLLITPEGTAEWITGEHIETNSTHGTGCAFSSAFLCGLAEGRNPSDAAHRAKRFVTEALRQATPRGHGKGPMHLLWPLTPTF